MKEKIIAIILLIMMTASLPMVGSSDQHNPMLTNNIMYFKDSPKNVTIGDTFRFDVWCDVNWEINAISIDNLTYLPAGVLYHSSFARGFLFREAYDNASDSWSGIGTAHNIQGYRLGPLWMAMPPAPGDYRYNRNNTDELSINNTWTAHSVGTATVTMAGASGTANGSDFGTTKLTGTVYVHPARTNGFDASLSTPILVALSWTKGNGAANTIIRGSKTSYPSSPTSGTAVYNSTGSSTTHSISAGEHWYYRAWSYNNSLFSLTNQTDQVQSNSPPVFGTPAPTNGSTGQSLDFLWGIPINDPEGNTFNYTMQCSNGEAIAPQIGVHNQTLANFHLFGLLYSTTYTVYVNATDSGSHLWTRAWYTFQTKANLPPTITGEHPTNGSTGQNKAFTWNTTIRDPNGDHFSWNIHCSNGQTNSVGSDTNGSKILTLIGLSYSTLYHVWVNVTDAYGMSTHKWYNFTTKADVAPTQTGANPANKSTGVSQTLTWTITLVDPDDNLNWYINCSNGQHSLGLNQAPGLKSLSLTGLLPLTNYTVWVNATDGILWTRARYWFITAANTPPDFGTPTPANGAINQPISLTWSIPISDAQSNPFSWTLHCSNGQTTSGGATGPTIASISLTGLSYLTNYTMWVNATDPNPPGSGGVTSHAYHFITVANQPPNVPTIILPADGETNVNPNVQHLRVFVTDPESHDMNVEYFWGNGTNIGADIGVKSGHISQIKIPKLLENTNYSWYVNITDAYGAWTIGPVGAPANNWTFQTGRNGNGVGNLAGENEISLLVLYGYTPVPGAIVTIYQSTITNGVQAQGEVVSILSTDTNGIRLFNLPAGTYILDIKAPGYQPMTQTLVVSQSSSIVVNLQKTVSEMGYWIILIIILLIVGLLIAILIKRQNYEKGTYGQAWGQIFAALFNGPAIILSLLFFWPLMIVSIILYIVEVLWLFGYAGK